MKNIGLIIGRGETDKETDNETPAEIAYWLLTTSNRPTCGGGGVTRVIIVVQLYI